MSNNVEGAWGDTFDITDTTDAELVDSREFALSTPYQDGKFLHLVEELVKAEDVDSRMKALDRVVRLYVVHVLRERGIEDLRGQFDLNTSLPPYDMEFGPLDVDVDGDEESDNLISMMTTEGVRAYIRHYIEEVDKFPYPQQNNFVEDAVRWRIGLDTKYV
jgi:hypothetical protein